MDEGGDIFTALLTGPARANLLILAGLCWTAAVCWRFLAAPPALGGTSLSRPTTSWWRTVGTQSRRHPYAMAQLLVALGFWLSLGTNTVWFVVVALTVALLTEASLRLLRRSAPEPWIAGPITATVLATAALVQLGGLLLVRLVIVRDPDDPFGAGLRHDALIEGWWAFLFPMVLLAAVLAGFWLIGPAWRQYAKPGRARGLRSWSGTPVQLDGVRPWTVRAGAGLALLLFALPLLPGAGGREGDAALTFRGIATPEYGKIVFLVVLAVVVARDGHRFFTADGGTHLWSDLRRAARRQLTFRELRALRVQLRYAAYPMAFFALVAALSGIRHDFGTLVPALAVMIGVTWAATRRNADKTPLTGTGPGWQRGSRGLGRTLAAYRPFLAAGAVMFVLAGFVAVLFTNYVDERGRVWADPWSYRWDSGCVTPEGEPPATVPGVVFCQESFAANLEAARSQASKALAAVADGGLWGQGLHDSASSVVPVGATDFIIAVVWNKLGGLIVLLIALVVTLLCAALRRIVPAERERHEAAPSVAFLVGAGLAAMIIGQFLFVFAATLNVVPHSGIPAPFLSRGGHSTLALLAGIALLLAMAPKGAPAGKLARTAPEPVRRRVLTPGVTVPVAVCLLFTVMITLLPYQSPGVPFPSVYSARRQTCELRESSREGINSPRPDPAVCSTDRVAYNRTKVEISFNGGTPLRQNRTEGAWEFPGGAPAGLDLTDLTGLVGGPYSGAGIVDLSFPDVVDGTAGSPLGRRLAPAPGVDDAPVDGLVDLTIDPRLQHVTAVAMRTASADGAGPLAGGMVVLDAATGHILAGVSVPVGVAPGLTPDLTAAEKALDGRREYGRLGVDGTLVGAEETKECDRSGSSQAELRSCWRWSYVRTSTGLTPAQRTDLRRYVGGERDVDLPAVSVNRAFGKWYGLGSTFKVVIGAAYLRAGGSLDEWLDAPETIVLADDIVVHNSGRGGCEGAENNQIRLRDAYTHSCNTAFVGLAQRLGWPAIARQAALFGMRVGACEKSGAWLRESLAGVVDTCVPRTSSTADIGNNALGGLDVQGTPLAMATVMAAVANGGTAVRPSLVRSVRTPGTGATVSAGPPLTQAAMSKRDAATLAEALGGVAEDGTARGLAAAVGMKIRVKTGTHEVIPAGEALPRGQFVRVDSWLVGFVETKRGPVAFAVVVEAKDEKAGARRVRYLVEKLCEALRSAP